MLHCSDEGEALKSVFMIDRSTGRPCLWAFKFQGKLCMYTTRFPCVWTSRGKQILYSHMATSLTRTVVTLIGVFLADRR